MTRNECLPSEIDGVWTAMDEFVPVKMRERSREHFKKYEDLKKRERIFIFKYQVQKL